MVPGAAIVEEVMAEGTFLEVEEMILCYLFLMWGILDNLYENKKKVAFLRASEIIKSKNRKMLVKIEKRGKRK